MKIGKFPLEKGYCQKVVNLGWILNEYYSVVLERALSHIVYRNVERSGPAYRFQKKATKNYTTYVTIILFIVWRYEYLLILNFR